MTELIGIGEAARRFGLATSALRYYDERGIVRPLRRHGDQRRYGPDELRRLAFVQLCRRLGLSLAEAAAIMDGPANAWRPAVERRIAELDKLISWANSARYQLSHALACPADHPVTDCPHLGAVLDGLTGVPSGPSPTHEPPAGSA